MSWEMIEGTCEAGETRGMHEYPHASDDDAALRPVSITISVLAVLVVLVAALSHRAHTYAVLAQNRTVAEWSYYESRVAGQSADDAFLDLLSVAQVRDGAKVAKLEEKYRQKLKEKNREEKQFETSADVLEAQVVRREAAANRFDVGNVFLEAAVVISSITMLTKRRLYWGIGLGFAVAGIAIAITGAFVTSPVGY